VTCAISWGRSLIRLLVVMSIVVVLVLLFISSNCFLCVHCRFLLVIGCKETDVCIKFLKRSQQMHLDL